MILFEPGKTLLNETLDDNIFLLEPYIPRESVIMLFGRPTIGKTPICWQFAQAIQTGQPLWGMPVQQANVLFLELDTPLRLVHHRWKDADPPFEPEFIIAFESMTIDCTQFLSTYPDERHREIVDAFGRIHSKYQFGLVIIDALRHVVLGDINTGGVSRRVYDAFRAIFPGASLLFIHHEKKIQQGNFGAPEPMHLAAGSMEFINIAQVSLQFHKAGKQTYLSHIKTQASEMYPPLPLNIAPDGVWVIDKLAERNDRALKVIVAADPGMGKRDLDRLVAKELGISERTARTIKRGLLQGGLLKENE